MASASAAGFGFAIDIREVQVLVMMLVLALIIINAATAQNKNFLEVIDKNIIGYPVCEAALCVAPSAANLQVISSSFSDFFTTISSPAKFLQLIFSSFSVLIGLVSTLVVLQMFGTVVAWVYDYYDKMGVFSW